MKLIILPLVLLVIIMIVAQAHGNSGSKYGTGTMPNTNINQGGTVNGAGSNYSQTLTYGSFSATQTDGILAVVVALVAVMAVVGVRVVGSGLSETSIKIIYNSVFFYSIWGIISVFALNADNKSGLLNGDIPFAGGAFFFFMLTLFYSIGIVQQINSGGSSGGST